MDRILAVPIMAALIASFVFGVYRVNTVFAVSTDRSPAIFPPDSKPYGLTYSQWAAKWWQWAISIPEEKNPMNDIKGENCGVGQQGPVWFLAGTSGGKVTRTCTVPSDKALFINILSSECSFKEYPDKHTTSDLLSCAIENNKGPSFKLTVDGVPIQNLQKYNVETPSFDVTFPPHAVFPSNNGPGPTKAAQVGFYVMLYPLPRGEHTIVYSGSNLPSPSTNSAGYTTDVELNLIVK